MSEPSPAFLKVLPQLLGLTFAMVLFGTLLGKTVLLYVALGLLFGLIIRARIVILLGEVLHELISRLGQLLVVLVLSAIYFLFMTPYSLLYRLLESKTVRYFKARNAKRSFFVVPEAEYQADYFKQPW